MSYGNGTAATWAYDAAGQVLSIVYANQAGEVLSGFGYGYDGAGNRKYKAFADGTQESYGYDVLNRLTGVDYPGGKHVEYGYDGVGNRQSLLDSTRTLTRWAATASASSQYASSTPAQAAVGPPNDQAGCWPIFSTGGSWWAKDIGVQATLDVGFASAERAKGIRIREQDVGGTVMRVDLFDEGGGTHTVYQGGDQTKCGDWLTVAFPVTSYKVKGARVYVNSATKNPAIDAVGLDVPGVDTYAYNGFNQLLSVSGYDGSSTTFGYDGNGNQTSKLEKPWGGAQALTQYVYNPDNRLVGIALPSGGSNAFEYDANGLRTRKTDSSGTSRFLLDGLSIVGQYGTDGTRQAWYTQSLARIDEVLSVSPPVSEGPLPTDLAGARVPLSRRSSGWARPARRPRASPASPR